MRDADHFAQALPSAPTRELQATLVRRAPMLAMVESAPLDFLFTSGIAYRYNPRGLECIYFAEAEATVMAIERDQLWRLMEQAPVVARNLLRLLAGRVRNDNRMLQDADRRQSLYEKEATIDALTGLRNRRWLNDAFARQLQRSMNAGQTVSVLMFDADRFKRINDTHGHLVGDEVLIHVGQTLANGLRPLDLLARYGGEEFTALLPNVSRVDALSAAERLRHAVENDPPRTAAGVLMDVTVSIGVATAFAAAPPTLLALLERADAALLEAKRSGRNCVRGESVESHA